MRRFTLLRKLFMNRDDLATNPLMHEWNTPYGLPPFSEIRAEHFVPAFEVALPAHLAELDAIAHHAEAPTFANTAFAFDTSGRRAQRLEYLLSNLASSETSSALQAVERTMAPLLAAHENAIYMNSALFARIDALFDARASLGLEAEEQRLLERIHLDFVRAGAKLHSDTRARYAEVTQELATLYASFGQNVLADEASYALELKDAADWAGLPESLCAALRTAASERGWQVRMTTGRWPHALLPCGKSKPSCWAMPRMPTTSSPIVWHPIPKQSPIC
jgi:peptidyl-dipeptidase Dcp